MSFGRDYEADLNPPGWVHGGDSVVRNGTKLVKDELIGGGDPTLQELVRDTLGASPGRE